MNEDTDIVEDAVLEGDPSAEKETPLEDGIPAPEEEAAPETGTLSESEKKLANMEKRLRDTETALKDRQREFFEFAKTSGATEAQLKQLMEAQKQKEETDPLDDPKIDEQLSTDPLFVKKLIRDRDARLKQDVVQLFRDRDAYWMEREQKLRGMVMESSPAMAKYRAAYDELKGQSWFDRMDDDAKQAVVKTFAAKTTHRPDTVNPVSGRRPPRERAEEVNEDAEALAKYLGLDGEPKDQRIVI